MRREAAAQTWIVQQPTQPARSMASASVSATNLEMWNAGEWEMRCVEEDLAAVEEGVEKEEEAEAGEEVGEQVEGEAVEVPDVGGIAGGLLAVQGAEVGEERVEIHKEEEPVASVGVEEVVGHYKVVVEEVGERVLGLHRVEEEGVEVVDAEEVEGLPKVGEVLLVVGGVGVGLHKQEEGEEAVEVVAVVVELGLPRQEEVHLQAMVEVGGAEEAEAMETAEDLILKKEEKRKVEGVVREEVANQRIEGGEVVEEEKVKDQGVVVVEAGEVEEEDRVNVHLTQTVLQATLSALSTAFVSVNLTNQEDRTVGDRVEVEVVAKEVEEEAVVEGVEEVVEKGHAHLTATAPLRTPLALSGVSVSVPPTSQGEVIVGEVEEGNTMGNAAPMQIALQLTRPALSGDFVSVPSTSLVIQTVTLGPGSGRWKTTLGQCIALYFVHMRCQIIVVWKQSNMGHCIG